MSNRIISMKFKLLLYFAIVNVILLIVSGCSKEPKHFNTYNNNMKVTTTISKSTLALIPTSFTSTLSVATTTTLSTSVVRPTVIIATPTYSLGKSATKYPSETLQNLYVFSNTTSLIFSLQDIHPSDVKEELTLYFAGGGAGDDNYCYPTCFDDDFRPYTSPVVVSTDVFRKYSEAFEFRFSIRVCGYEEGDHLNITLLSPEGEPVQKIRADVEPYIRWDQLITYCYNGNIGQIDLLQGASSGQYQAIIHSQYSDLATSFENISSILNRKRPAITFSGSYSGYVLSGFEPFENVRILLYDENQDSLVLVGETELTLDSNGMALITGKNENSELFVLRENLDFVTTSSFTPIGGILNYDEIINDPNRYEVKADAYYQRGMRGATNSTDEVDERILDMMIALNHDQYEKDKPGYERIACLFKKQGLLYDAIDAYTQLVKWYPDEVSVYWGRVHLYLKTGQYSHAFDDYSKIIEITPTDSMAYYERGRLAEMYDVGKYEQMLEDYVSAVAHTNVRYVGELYYENYPHCGFVPSRKAQPTYNYLDMYNSLLEYNPNNSLGRYKRGVYYHAGGLTTGCSRPRWAPRLCGLLVGVIGFASEGVSASTARRLNPGPLYCYCQLP